MERSKSSIYRVFCLSGILGVQDLVWIFFGKVSPEESLYDNEIPVCFIHGEDDNFIPCSQSQRMHKINKGYSELHTFPKADHAQSLDSDVERYEDILRDFVAKVL